MHTYRYEKAEEPIPEKVNIFFQHHDPEVQRIIHLATILTVEIMSIITLVMGHAYFNLSSSQVYASPIVDESTVLGVQSAPTPAGQSPLGGATPLVPSPTPAGQTPSGGQDSVQRSPLGGAQPNDIILQPAPESAANPQSTPSKQMYKIVIYGDSMVDTMGEVCEYLDHALKKTYPSISFLCYNFGVGSQNVKDGIARFHNRLDYQSRHYPSIDEIKPDIIVLGSFAYNVLIPPDRDEHWLRYTDLVHEAQKTGAQIYMLAEIAPLRATFGSGPQGVNWETHTVIKHSGHIIDQLENVLGLSRTLHVPLIDSYTPSLLEGKKEGKAEYVNPSDGIHPSVAGHEFMSQKIAETIVLR